MMRAPQYSFLEPPLLTIHHTELASDFCRSAACHKFGCFRGEPGLACFLRLLWQISDEQLAEVLKNLSDWRQSKCWDLSELWVSSLCGVYSTAADDSDSLLITPTCRTQTTLGPLLTHRTTRWCEVAEQRALPLYATHSTHVISSVMEVCRPTQDWSHQYINIYTRAGQTGRKILSLSYFNNREMDEHIFISLT